jgi:hypothetical protein
MSNQLTTVAVTEFDAMVKQSYQAGGSKLRPYVTVRTKIVGSTYKFRKIGRGVATPRIPQSDIIPMNVGYSEKSATLTDWNAADYTDLFNQAEVNFDEQKELAFVISSAMGRRDDQLIIDALDAANQANQTVATSIGGTNTGLNLAKLRKAKRLLDAAGVPSGDRAFTCSAIGMNDQLLGTTEATSADYNSVRALVQGEVDTFVGFKFVMIEDRDEGGLALASNSRSNFAFHKDAMGLAVGIDMRTEINYIPEKTSWLAAGLFKAGATDRDGTYGIVECATYE